MRRSLTPNAPLLTFSRERAGFGDVNDSRIMNSSTDSQGPGLLLNDSKSYNSNLRELPWAESSNPLGAVNSQTSVPNCFATCLRGAIATRPIDMAGAASY